MPRLVVVTAALVAVIAASPSVGNSCRLGTDCAAADRSAAQGTNAAPFLGVVYDGLSGSGPILARLDPRSLRPVSPHVQLGEYHRAWSLSPDGSHAAFGISSGASLVTPPRRIQGRIGVIVVDLETMKIAQEVATGIAAEAVAWLRARRLVASLQSGGTVLIDPRTGAILRRWRGFSSPLAWARARDRLIMLFRGSHRETSSGRGTFALRIAVADGRTLTLRSASLGRVRLGRTKDGFYNDAAGLAVDPAGRRAYVVAAGSPLAEIDLATLRVEYRRLGFLLARAGSLQGTQAPPERVLNRSRVATWLPNGRLLVSGADIVARRGRGEVHVPAGATVVNMATWSSRTFDAGASGAAFARGVLLAYGPRWDPGAGIGLRGYTIDGRRTFHLLNEQRVWNVHVVDDWAYALTPKAVRIIDVGRTQVIGTIAPPRELVDLIQR